MQCAVNGVQGVRNCTCGGGNTLNCPGGNNGCIRPMVDAGFNMCMNNFPCTAGFACEMPCNVGGVAGMRNCTCPANGGTLNCPGGNAGCIRPMPDAAPPPDAGLNACVVNTFCTQGFTCRGACVAGGVAGTRNCMCDATNRVACPGGGGNPCVPNDGGTPDIRPDVVATPDVRPPVDAPADMSPG
jgi:hypothetical protein